MTGSTRLSRTEAHQEAVCRRLADEQRWDRIFRERFADAGYYTRRATPLRSSFPAFANAMRVLYRDCGGPSDQGGE